MSAVRLLLVLMIALVFDLGSPVLPEPDDGETYEEATHGHRRLHHLVTRAQAQAAQRRHLQQRSEDLTAHAKITGSQGSRKDPRI